MSDSFDGEISRALKQGAAKELEGWEFTPAMKARVLDRIRAEEAAPAAPASRRSGPAPVLRPLAWVAVAAAAVMVVVNVGLPPMGSSKKDAAPAAPSAATNTKAMETASAPQQQAAKTAETKSSGAAGTNAPAATPAPAAAPGTGPVETAKAEKGAAESGIAFMAGAVAQHPVVQLTAPVETADAAAPALKRDAGSTTMGMLAVPPRHLALGFSSGGVVTLTERGVQHLNAGWSTPIEGLAGTPALAVAPDGRVAVSNGGNGIIILSTGGQPQRTINATAAVSQLVWSADGRLASAEGSLTFVYDAATGKPLFYVDAGPAEALAFLPDGSLAVFGGARDLLVVTDRRGAILLEARPATGGHGLAVVDGGNVVVGAGKAYDRSGQVRWEMPWLPAGMITLGTDKVVAWNANSVLVVDGAGGQVLLEAAWNGPGQGVTRVVPSADGRHVAILAVTEQGPVVWVLDSDGTVVFTEKLGEMPVDMGMTGGRLVLMLEHAVIVREVDR